ncbi:unnamed protein product [Ilex paraguariensis]|uniref:Uncharacterized protein n=1 Tax=Ilex paraguariensis TaxID=185542 RepID=A0ABC8RHL5_9AQUA
MQAQRQQLWNLYVHARAKGFHFKLKATDILPAGKFFQFSILLKLWPFRIEVKLEPTKQKSLESKFLQFLKKFRVRRADNKAIAARKTLNSGRSSRFAYVVGQRSVFIGNLALLCQSISEKDQKGIILHGSIQMKSYLLIYVYGEGHASEYVWKARTYTSFSGCLYLMYFFFPGDGY